MNNNNIKTENDNGNKNNSVVGKTIATKIPLNMYEEISYLIENGSYLSISDFLRESMREHLKTVKVSKVRDISYDEGKKEVLSYFKEFNDCYLDEIVFNLNFDFDFVSAILDDLLLEGRIQLNDFSTLNSDIDFSSNFLKLYGKRLIVEAKSIDNEFLRIKSPNKSINVKNKGLVLENGITIISNHYSLIK